MPPSALLLWLFVRSALLPHEPASLNVVAAELPAARSAYGWLETTAPEVISERFDAGGLTVGRPPRIGVHGTSSADTTFRIGGLDATSTLRPGTPMALLDVVGASSIDVTRLASDVSMSAPGPVVEWQPRAGNTRAFIAESFFMPAAWAITNGSVNAPPIAQLRALADGSLLLAGELVPNEINAVLSAHWERARRLERRSANELEATQLSLLGHLNFRPSPRDDAQVTFMTQRVTNASLGPIGASPAATSASTDDSYGAAQGVWRRAEKDHAAYRVAGGYQWMDVASPIAASASIDAGLDGAVFPALFRPSGKEQALRLAADVSPAAVRVLGMTHQLKAGGSFDRSSMSPILASTSLMAETVNGVAARAWRVDVPSTPPSWSATTGAIFAGDRLSVGESGWLEAGVRVESLHASNGGSTSLSWTALYPHAALDLFSRGAGIGIFGTYTRVGARLPPMALAFGDANAPSARVYRWVDTNGNGVLDGAEGSGASSLVARVGPGAAGGLTAINPAVKRPVINLLMGGIRVDTARFAMSVTAISRKQDDFVRAVADGGAAYETVVQDDPNADFSGPGDDQKLVGYSRTTASFGLDHYTLTNPAGMGEGSTYTLDISAQYRGRRVRLAFSAAAVKAMGTGANRGFRADENDPGLVGDVLTNPNATTNAPGGRTFFDRGYVGKIVGVFTLPGQASLGIVARYQDGQPFSRLAIFSTLNQGPEAVMAYSNGRPTRFTYISTTDVRLQKTFAFGSGGLTLIVDAFNVFNIGREVEEYVLTDAAFRARTAIEPPRTIRVGVRFAF